MRNSLRIGVAVGGLYFSVILLSWLNAVLLSPLFALSFSLSSFSVSSFFCAPLCAGENPSVKNQIYIYSNDKIEHLPEIPAHWKVSDKKNNDAEELFLTVVNTRKKEIAYLCNVINNHRARIMDRNFEQAVLIAGEIRAAEIVTILTDKIDIAIDKSKLHKLPPIEKTYLIVDTLIKIGYPAVNSLLKRIIKEDGTLPRNLCLIALERILGKLSAKNAIKEMLKNNHYSIDEVKRINASLIALDFEINSYSNEKITIIGSD